MFPSKPNPPAAADNAFSDRHLVETPEQIHLEFAIAGIGSRFLALALDTLFQIMGSIAALLLGFLIWIWGSRYWGAGSPWFIAAGVLYGFVLYFGYFALFEIFWNGQTPGKRIVGIRVIKETGGPLSPAESIGRNLMRIVDQLPGFYAIGIVTAMCNSQSKRLGDFVAGSIVIRESALDEKGPSWITQPDSVSSASMGGARLTAEEIHLIHAFLARRSGLPEDVRRRMAEDILKRLQPRLGLTFDDLYRREATLEALAHHHRS